VAQHLALCRCQHLNVMYCSVYSRRVRFDRKEQGFEWPGDWAPIGRQFFFKFSSKNAGFMHFTFLLRKLYLWPETVAREGVVDSLEG